MIDTGLEAFVVIEFPMLCVVSADDFLGDGMVFDDGAW